MFEKVLDFVVLILSLFIVCVLILEVSGHISEESRHLFIFFDLFACSVFLFEFFYYLNKAEDKKQYWKENWINFIASIPFYYFQSLRFVYVFRVLRIIRVGMLSIRILEKVNGLLRRGSLLYITLFSSTLLILGSVGLYAFEEGKNAGINSIWDAAWFVIVTMTTVGYGDITVSSPESRLLTVIIMIAGITIFSVLTATISSFLVEENESTRELEKQVKIMGEELKEMKELLKEMHDARKKNKNEEG